MTNETNNQTKETETAIAFWLDQVATKEMPCEFAFSDGKVFIAKFGENNRPVMEVMTYAEALFEAEDFGIKMIDGSAFSGDDRIGIGYEGYHAVLAA